MDIIVVGVIAIVVGVFVGALLASVDSALSSLGDVGLAALRDAGGKNGETAGQILGRLDSIQARYLAGRSICVAFAASAASIIGYAEKGPALAFAATAVVALTYSTTVEVSSTLAHRRAGRWALTMFRWLRPLELLFAPLGLPVQRCGEFVERRFANRKSEHSENLTELTVEHMIGKGEEAGDIDEDQADLLRSVLEFKDTIAREVMVPRTRVVAFDVRTPIADVLDRIIEVGHSRYPVFQNTLDEVIGVLYAKDLFRVVDAGTLDTAKLRGLIRKPVFFVSEAQKIDSVLRSMQTRRVHLTIATDEFGGTAGILTLEDILEEIVGEIEDEHDSIFPAVQKVGDRKFVADAGISVYDLQDFLGISLVDATHADFDSLGGFIINLAGRVPESGEQIVAGEHQFVIREADAKSIAQVEIRLADENADSEPAPSPAS